VCVLRQQPSQLLLIRTNLGHGTVGTAFVPVRFVVPLIAVTVIRNLRIRKYVH
jgi:hypothetical protein